MRIHTPVRAHAQHGSTLTTAERQLLGALRLLGLDVRRGFLKDSHGDLWQHPRTVVKGSPSWSHSQHAS